MSTIKAVEDCHQLIKWVIPCLDRFPRNRRFTLGERLETHLLEILNLLVCAAYSRCTDKLNHLSQANLKLESTRHLWRLCYELKVINSKKYQFGSRGMLEIGQQVGGWKKQIESV